MTHFKKKKRSLPQQQSIQLIRPRFVWLQTLVLCAIVLNKSQSKLHIVHASTTQKDVVPLSKLSPPMAAFATLEPQKWLPSVKKTKIPTEKYAKTMPRTPSSLFVSTSTASKGNSDVAVDYKREILSNDPLVYVVHNVLSPEECHAFINRAKTISAEESVLTKEEENGDDGTPTNRRSMTRSNPPEVSLDVSKLWPLPFLSMGAAIPPLIRLFQSSSSAPTTNQLIYAALPPTLVALTLSAILAIAITEITKRIFNQSSRTSDAIAFNDDEDVEFIRPLVERICSQSVSNGHSWEAFEAPVVTRYEPGAVFARHNDASPTKGSEWADLGGQRAVTVILYLNTCIKGGGTSFDKLGVTVQPKEGSALVFFPSDATTCVADDRTTHESLPAVEEKWIVQMFGRVGPRVPPPLGIPDSFGK